MIEAIGLSYSIGALEILQDVSLTVRPGEVVALVGPNGAGKTTLLRLLSGTDLVPSAGEITIDGTPLAELSPAGMARHRALLSQEQQLQADFPAFDVVLMGRTPHVVGREQPRDYQIAAAALSNMRAQPLADRPFTVLSGGEKQRIALARAGAQIWEPLPSGNRYLLLDEPTNNLDLAHQHIALGRARDWASDGVGVVTVLHDLNLAAQYADRLVVLHTGRVVSTGSPREVLTQTLMRSVFLTDARIEDHPCLDCPLVVSLRALDEQEERNGRYTDISDGAGRALAHAQGAGVHPDS
jgi:iron complex transport system ATP-binding protein